MIKKLNFGYLIAFILLLASEFLIGGLINDNFIRPYVGDVLVVMVIYTFFRTFLRRNKWLPLIIFGFAVLVECIQILEPARRLGIENQFIRTILGGVFDYKDLICYLTGTAIIYLIEYRELFFRINSRK